MEKKSFVCVAVFSQPHESFILRARLDDEGIDYFAENENVIATQPFYSNAVGGIKIQVPEAQSERALEIVAEMNRLQNSSDSFLDDDDQYVTESEYHEDDISEAKGKYNLWTIILIAVAVLMFVVLALFR